MKNTISILYMEMTIQKKQLSFFMWYVNLCAAKMETNREIVLQKQPDWYIL